MRTTLTLVGRNLTIYFRDRTGVFLSLLSALILLLLYTLFLGSLQVDTIRESLPNATEDEVRAFVNTWVLAGIIMITTFTTGFGSMGVFVDDRVSGRFRDFRVAPLKRWQLILGYLGAAFVVAVLMATIILSVGVGILVALHSTSLFTWGGIAQSFGLILLLSLAFASISAGPARSRVRMKPLTIGSPCFQSSRIQASGLPSRVQLSPWPPTAPQRRCEGT